MGVVITGELFNGTSTKLCHDPSQVNINTAPPVDNGGDGSSFSPTDLCAASLGACATTIMALYAKNHRISIKSIKFKVEKTMQAAPRRISKLTVAYHIESACSAEEFEKLKAAAKTCPVRLSLSPEVEVEETFFRIAAGR